MRNRVPLRCLALGLSICVAGCGGLHLFPGSVRPGVHSPGVARDTLHSLQGRGDGDANYKMVIAKQAPTTLIADDGSWCVVDVETYAATKLKERVRCAWIR